MTYTPIPRGSVDWDTPLNAALSDQDTRITTNASALTLVNAELDDLDSVGASNAAISQFIAAPYPPEFATGNSGPGAGDVRMIQVKIPAQSTVTSAVVAVTTAGSGLTAGQNFVGLYNSTGNLVAVSSDQTTAWSSSGAKTGVFTTPYLASPGIYYIAIVSNGTTPPVLARALSAPAIADALNYNLTSQNYRWATGATGQTSLPSSINMATRSVSGLAFWAAIV